MDEAAENYERADAAVIWLAPSANAQMATATPGDFQGAMSTEQHTISLKEKDGTRSERCTYVASPFEMGCSPEEARHTSNALLATFDRSKPEVETKYQNTTAFLQNNLREHAATWAQHQELLGRLSW